jgi:hypothetical protein
MLELQASTIHKVDYVSVIAAAAAAATTTLRISNLPSESCCED